MMKISFKSIVTSAKTSPEGSRLRSVFPFGCRFRRLAGASALAACLMTAAPPDCTWAVESRPNAAASSRQSALANLDQFIRSLKSEETGVRKSAVEELTWLGESAKPAVPQLLITLQDHDPIVRASAARAVWEIGQRADEAVPVLVRLLKSQDNSHRELAAYFLGPLGEAAKPAIPALRQAMRDNNPTVRVHAAEALTQIDPIAPDAVEVLLSDLRHEHADVRSLAAMAFSNVAPIHAEKVVPALTAALGDSDSGVRASVELALPNFNLDVVHSGQQFPGAEAANSPAKSFLEASAAESSVSPTADNISPFSHPDQTPGQPLGMSAELEKAVRDLSHANPAVRKNALDRIGWMGANAEPALADVAVCLQDPQPEIRAYAAKTLWDIDPRSALAAVNTLRDMLDSTQPGVRPLAAFYLGYMGRHAASALHTLRRALSNTESTEQLQIAEAIARINPEDPDAVTVLLGGLRDPESQVRFQAAYALSAVSPLHAERVIPELATAMRDQSPQVRQAAELALASFPTERFPAPAAEVQSTPAPATEVQSTPASTLIEKVQPISAPVAEVQSIPAPVAKLQPIPAAPALVEEVHTSETSQVALFDSEPVAPAVVVPVQEPMGHGGIPLPADSATMAQSPENRLGLGEDYKPITAVNISIAPKRRDEDGKLLPLPTNYGAAWLHEVGSVHHPIGESRPWAVQSMQYAASGFCHRPLYFEEINLERYGHNFGHYVQPFVSGVAFFGRAPLLPYMMAAEPHWECQYTLGHYRPGSCAPFQPSHLPWSTTGALVQAGIVTGLFFAIY